MPNHLVSSENLLIKISHSPKVVPLKKISIIGRFEQLKINPDFLEELEHNFTTFMRLNQSLRTAVGDSGIPIYGMFVTLGMPPKIVVVI